MHREDIMLTGIGLLGFMAGSHSLLKDQHNGIILGLAIASMIGGIILCSSVVKTQLEEAWYGRHGKEVIIHHI
jgi:hypothetical protein